MSKGRVVDYAIEPVADDEYVIITVIGDLTHEDVRQPVTDGFALGDQLGIRCFLIDVTEAANAESVLGSYRMTHKGSRRLSSRTRRSCVAVLASPQDDSHDFSVTLAQNAGLDVTLFKERGEAVAHLIAGAQRFRS